MSTAAAHIEELLASAGRAGQHAYDESMAYDRPTAKEADAALARGVLDTLGIEWTGEFQWGCRWIDTGEENLAAHEEEADRWVVLSNAQGRKVRRPKLTLTWQEVNA